MTTRVTSKGGSVTVTTTGRITIPVDRILDAVVPLAIGEVLDQNDNSIDADGKPFAPYSASYAAQLVAKGESTNVDHRVTGGLLGSLKERSRTVTADGGTVTIGPDPAHASIGARLQRWRKWLGVAPAGRARLARVVEKLLARGP